MSKRTRFCMVLSLEEKAALVALAEVDGGQSQAGWLRRLIRLQARQQGLWPVLTDKEVRYACAD